MERRFDEAPFNSPPGSSLGQAFEKGGVEKARAEDRQAHGPPSILILRLPLRFVRAEGWPGQASGKEEKPGTASLSSMDRPERRD